MHAGAVRQVGPGLEAAEPLPTPLYRTTSLRGEGKEHSSTHLTSPHPTWALAGPRGRHDKAVQPPLLAVLEQRRRDGTWPTIQTNANVPSPLLSLVDKCHPLVSSVLQALCLSCLICQLGMIEIDQLRPGVPSTSSDSADLVFAASQCYRATLFHPSSHSGAPCLRWPLCAPCGSVGLAPTRNSVAVPTVAPHPTRISMLFTIAGHHRTQQHPTKIH